LKVYAPKVKKAAAPVEEKKAALFVEEEEPEGDESAPVAK